jgi:pimeloyl-ACP methyl ester carboxylesterase
MIRTSCLLLSVALLAGGCVFRDVREQQALIDENCVIEGRAASAGTGANPIVVVLARRTGAQWRIVDHFVLERPGRWGFGAAPGTYGLAAFEDTNRDLVYQPGEPLLPLAAATPIECGARQRLRDVELVIPAGGTARLGSEIDIAALQARSQDGQVSSTLGQLTAVGERAALGDARFSVDNATDGLWRPFDFVVSGYAGVYFLEPYDPAKVPVLFVHGINGTPASFDYLIERLDRARFQPWVYYYPSGAHLPGIADHLDQTVAKLQLRHRVTSLAVVAHSMGGLVARGFIQRHAKRGGAGRIAPFITISTPWEGHRAAELGVKTAPAVVRVWEDMAPGSEYLRGLFAQTLPLETPHYLLFTFNRKASSFGASDDQSVTVASQLSLAAQLDAERVYGFDDTHTGVLRNADVSKLVNALLARGR